MTSIFPTPPSGCQTVGFNNLANGSQLVPEISIEGNGNVTAATLPVGLQAAGGPGTRFYVVGCSASCGAPGSTFQLAAVPGGSPLTGACTGTCFLANIAFSMPLQTTAGSSTITSPEAFVNWVVGTPIAFSGCGYLSCPIYANAENFAMPGGLVMNTVFYVASIAGRNFTVSVALGGPAVVLTTVGVGPLVAVTLT